VAVEIYTPKVVWQYVYCKGARVEPPEFAHPEINTGNQYRCLCKM